VTIHVQVVKYIWKHQLIFYTLFFVVRLRQFLVVKFRQLQSLLDKCIFYTCVVTSVPEL
jgi:hypothetical protein